MDTSSHKRKFTEQRPQLFDGEALHNCNSSDNSKSWDSGTGNVESLVLMRIPKQTISEAGSESFSGKEAKPRVSKINRKVARHCQPVTDVQCRKNHLDKHQWRNCLV